jgi:hypothetical protein
MDRSCIQNGRRFQQDDKPEKKATKKLITDQSRWRRFNKNDQQDDKSEKKN